MHTVLVWYEKLGLKHFARQCGFENEKQWNYLIWIASTDKTFEFFEHLADAVRIALMFKFITYVKKQKIYMFPITDWSFYISNKFWSVYLWIIKRWDFP